MAFNQSAFPFQPAVTIKRPRTEQTASTSSSLDVLAELAEQIKTSTSQNQIAPVPNINWNPPIPPSTNIPSQPWAPNHPTAPVQQHTQNWNQQYDNRYYSPFHQPTQPPIQQFTPLTQHYQPQQHFQQCTQQVPQTYLPQTTNQSNTKPFASPPGLPPPTPLVTVSTPVVTNQTAPADTPNLEQGTNQQLKVCVTE